MLFTNSGEVKFRSRELTTYEAKLITPIIMTLRQKFRAIKDAVFNTQLSISERKLYRWIVTQEKHKHLHSIMINNDNKDYVRYSKCIAVFYIKRK